MRRAQEIADYIDSGLGTIPGSIILSAQPDAELRFSANSALSFNKVPRAFLILDGQHRVFGFHQTKRVKRLRVPVVIYNGLPAFEEVRLFMDINTKQRPVPNELLLDIKRLAETESSEEATLRAVFDLFDKDPSSPLAGLTSASEKRPNKISRVTFNASLKQIYHSFGNSDARRVYSVLGGYLRAWHNGLKTKEMVELITNPTLFRAIVLLFPFVATRVSDRYSREFSTKNFSEILLPVLSKIRKSDLVRPGSTHVDLSESLRRRLEASFSIDGGSVL